MDGAFDSVKAIRSIPGDLYTLLPESILASLFVLVLLGSLLFSSAKIRFTQIFLLVGILALILTLLFVCGCAWEGSHFSHSMFNDKESLFFKFFFLAALIFTVLISLKESAVLEKASAGTVYYLLLISSTLGAFLMVSASGILLLYVSLELLSLSSYLLTGFLFSKNSAEGSVKYLLIGGTGSAFTLYGFSILFATTGEMEFSKIIQLLDPVNYYQMAGLIFSLVGFILKPGLVPAHIWAPDAYEAAPPSFLGYLSTVSKAAGLFVLIKALFLLSSRGVSVNQSGILIGLLMASLLAGNFAALLQTNFKRMLAYSSIAQSGFLLIGIFTLDETARLVTYFYLTILMLSNFLVIKSMSDLNPGGEILNFQGLGKRYPLHATGMAVGLISLVGLPPVAGFTAKLLVFSNLLSFYSMEQNQWLLFAFVFGLLNAVVSLFYYLKPVYFLFLKPETESAQESVIHISISDRLIYWTLIGALLVFFLKPDWLMLFINAIRNNP